MAACCSDFTQFIPGHGLAGSIASLIFSHPARRQAAHAAAGGGGAEGAEEHDEEAGAVRVQHQVHQGAQGAAQGGDSPVPLQPLEWVHLWPGHVAGRARGDMRVAHWRQYGGSAADAGGMCFAHDLGIRPGRFDCRDHHLLFFNSPAVNVSQTLPVRVKVPSTLTLKVLVDCCGAGWEGHDCDAHGGFRLALTTARGALLGHTW